MTIVNGNAKYLVDGSPNLCQPAFINCHSVHKHVLGALHLLHHIYNAVNVISWYPISGINLYIFGLFSLYLFLIEV